MILNRFNDKKWIQLKFSYPIVAEYVENKLKGLIGFHQPEELIKKNLFLKLLFVKYCINFGDDWEENNDFSINNIKLDKRHFQSEEGIIKWLNHDTLEGPIIGNNKADEPEEDCIARMEELVKKNNKKPKSIPVKPKKSGQTLIDEFVEENPNNLNRKDLANYLKDKINI